MPLHIYGAPMSTCTRLVVTVAEELGIPFEFHTIDMMAGGHKAPEFIAKQPFGQVPYIDDDGFILYESRAISRYLAHKHQDKIKLIPAASDLKATALFEQAASIEAFNFDKFASPIAVERVFKPMFRKIEGDEVLAKNLENMLSAKLDAYDVILGKQKYLAGDELTLADLFHLPYGHTLSLAKVNLLTDGSKPNVARWWKDITSRPTWQKNKDSVPV